MSHDGRPVATPSQTVGPFFSFGLTTNRALGRLVGSDASGSPLRLIIRVVDGDGTPVPDAMIELWHVDDGERFRFGRLGTNTDGACEFETILPPQKPREASHINICLFMRGLMRHLYTRVYFGDDDTLIDDATLALVPADRRETLIAHPVPNSPGVWRFDVRLQGEAETVFFDL